MREKTDGLAPTEPVKGASAIRVARESDASACAMDTVSMVPAAVLADVAIAPVDVVVVPVVPVPVVLEGTGTVVRNAN